MSDGSDNEGEDTNMIRIKSVLIGESSISISLYYRRWKDKYNQHLLKGSV